MEGWVCTWGKQLVSRYAICERLCVPEWGHSSCLDFTEREVLQVISLARDEVLTFSGHLRILKRVWNSHSLSLLYTDNEQKSWESTDLCLSISPQTSAFHKSSLDFWSSSTDRSYNHLIYLTWRSTQDSSEDQRPYESLHQNKNPFKS